MATKNEIERQRIEDEVLAAQGSENARKLQAQLSPVKLGSLGDIAEAATFDEMLAALEGNGFTVDTVDADLIGDGYELIKDKSKLVNIPMIALHWTFAKSEYGDEPFAIVVAILQGSNRKVRFTDGSSGVRDELMTVTQKRIKGGSASPNVGLVLPAGLAKSEYTYWDEKEGKEMPAVTFHLQIPETV